MTAAIATAAAPIIGTVDYNSQGGGESVITGSAFGSGPRVVLVDNFDGHGDSQRLTLTGADRGRWHEIKNTPIAKGKGLVGKNAVWSIRVLEDGRNVRYPFTFLIPDANAPNQAELFQEIYLSYALKDEGNFPGEGGTETTFATRSSCKDAWLMLGNRGDQGYQNGKEYSGHDIVAPSWVGGNFSVGGNSTAMRPHFYQRDLRSRWVFQGWNQMFFHAKIDPDNPTGAAEGFFGFANTNGALFNPRNGNFMSDTSKAPFWDRIKFAPWHHLGNGGVFRLMDHIYIAIGENAAARVILADGPDLATISRMIHGNPLEWKDNRIVVDLPAIPQAEIADWYLFVIDAQNNFSAPMALICTTCPKPPQNLEVVIGD